MQIATHAAVAATLACALTTPVAAQAVGPARVAFQGAYAGVEAGLHEHHFYIDVTDTRTGESTGRYYRSWNLGGGAFAGYDVAVAPRVRLGGEIGISLGGATPVARFEDGLYAQRPRYGYRLSGRAGYLLTPRLMAYGSFGYGGHRYRILNEAEVRNANAWGSSFTVGGGFEYQASQRVGVRLDFKHLDNQMSHLLIGIPVRF